MKKRNVFFSAVLSLLIIGTATPVAGAAEYYLADGTTALADIAATTGIDAELLAAMNDVQEGAYPQGLLVLPEQPQLTITVQPGDTLYSLAAQRGIRVEDLAAANNLSEPYLIYPQQRLYYQLSDEQAAVYTPATDQVEEVLATCDTGGAITASASLASRNGGKTWLWPIDGVITSVFGQRSRGYHYGLDIAADTGTEISAAAGGVVTEADWKNDAYGYAVMIDHGNGYTTLYGHCSELLVESGQKVKAGESVALVGSTGNSTGPHVHFEVRINGSCTDPLEILP